MGAPRSAPGVVFGNLLVVSYRETAPASRRKASAPSARPFQPCSGDLAWGAPTRIVADAVFEFVDGWPSDDSGKIVLSQIELDDKCKVVAHLARRAALRRARPSSRPCGRSAWKARRTSTSSNRKVLYFHVDGGAPDSALLYLRGLPFSTLYYTELGKHTHKPAAANLNIDIGHTHDISGTVKTKAGQGTHKHAYFWDNGNFGAFDLENDEPAELGNHQ